jgi:hemerythrin-like domain-containing protein
MTAIHKLMAEHRVIERMLTLLERLAGRIDRDGDLPVLLLKELVDLLEQYVDVLHHTKEERQLFQIVIERGIEADGGAVTALMHHHDTGRSYLRDLRGELDRLRQGDRTASAACALTAHQYAEFLREHIRVEDDEVYPLIGRAMSAEEDDALAMRFAEMDDARQTGRLLAQFEELRSRCAALDDPRRGDGT